MAELRFDIRGNLTPYEPVEVTWAEFRETFVESFGEDSSRHGLWVNGERYFAKLRAQVGEPVLVWVNGSFATMRRNPGDVDLVVFINHEPYERHEYLLKNRFQYPNSGRFYAGIDAYTVKVFPEHHPKHPFTHSDRAYWYHWFSRSRSNRFDKNYKKGFVQLNC
jgi:pSer/pThr/pTyr-binding forkhead associated (FHA) protein